VLPISAPVSLGAAESLGLEQQIPRNLSTDPKLANNLKADLLSFVHTHVVLPLVEPSHMRRLFNTSVKLFAIFPHI
jgi:hypothetical protein